MAAPIPPLPEGVTIHNISGEWIVDKARTTGVEDNMALQGLSWLMRKTYSLAKVTLKTTMDGQEVDVAFVGTGFPVTLTEHMTLDWTERTVSLAVIGQTRTRSRFISFPAGTPITIDAFDLEGGDTPKYNETAADLAWLAEGWLAEEEDGGTALIQLQNRGLESGGTWCGHGIWGFMMVEGVRTHVRKTVVWNSKKSSQSYMVYHYLGAIAK